jgi:hypothetical protein
LETSPALDPSTAKATWWASVTYIDPKTGKRHDLQRRGQNKAHARDLLQALLRDMTLQRVKRRAMRERPLPNSAITLRSIASRQPSTLTAAR